MATERTEEVARPDRGADAEPGLRPRWKYNPLSAAVVKRYLDWRSPDLEAVIFVATTGRSGSASLTKVFERVEGCAALHEPYPAMNGLPLIERNNGDDRRARAMYRLVKAVNIRRAARGRRYYFEASHLFIKSFVDYALEDFGGRARVIHLWREPTQVAKSILSLGTVPGTEAGNRWYLDPRAPGNRIRIAHVLDGASGFGHDFYKCLWYWYEIEARVAFWRGRYPDVPFVDLAVTDLNDAARLRGLMDALGIPCAPEVLEEVASTRANLMEGRKRATPLEDDEMETMRSRFEAMLADEGYPVPGVAAVRT